MTTLDDEMLPAVLELLNELGTTAIWRKNILEHYDPNTGQTVKADRVSTALTVSPPTNTKNVVEGVLTETISVFVAGSGLIDVPQVNDELEFSTSKFKITEKKELWSGDKIAAYEFICQ